ncbi:hypothetical protein [Terasakiella sp. SH-1]|uniref:hypothetical protein n=1 Tax=Terasakiella sp. SH-1 TaxID=2560057 RepID=UPI0010746D48|nr:hypothetical protein [Terasakiella sp. SH-1]
MTQLDSRDQFEAWLKTQDAWVAIALTTRIGLRVIPNLCAFILRNKKEYSSTIALPVFRAIATAWCGGLRLKNVAGLRGAAIRAIYAGRASRYAVEADAGYFSDYAADIAADAAYKATCAVTAYISDNAFDEVVDVVLRSTLSSWQEISHDISLIEKGETCEQLMSRPLWGEVPQTRDEDWQELKTILLALNQNWQVWTQWYEDRLIGGPNPNGRQFLYPLEKERVLIPDGDWKKGPAHVNRLIAEIENRYRGVPEPRQMMQRPAVITLQRGDDDVVRLRPDDAPTAATQQQADHWQQAWEGVCESFEDFMELEPGRNNRALAKTLKRYGEALASQYTDLSVIKLGQHGKRLASLLQSASDELMVDVQAELAALLVNHNEFIQQIPEWLDYLKGLKATVANADVEFAFHTIENIEELIGIVDDEVIESFEQYLEDIMEDYVPSSEGTTSDPLVIDFVRSVGNLLSIIAKPVARYIREVGRVAVKGSLTAFEKLSEKFILTIGAGAAAAGLSQLSGIVSDYAWLLPILTFLQGGKKK